MFYFKKTPWWLKQIYSKCLWQVITDKNNIYLTFDDGPHPIATPFVLAVLKKYDAKATFFCIGKNVALYPDIYESIIAGGHKVANHTYDHLNGWKTGDNIYLENISRAAGLIESNLFRPPYGKITFRQINLLSQKTIGLKVIMWSVLSGDFDKTVSNQKCLSNVIVNAGKGSIVVFHDSEKALEKLQFTLPHVLDYFTKLNFKFDKIEVK